MYDDHRGLSFCCSPCLLTLLPPVLLGILVTRTLPHHSNIQRPLQSLRLHYYSVAHHGRYLSPQAYVCMHLLRSMTVAGRPRTYKQVATLPRNPEMKINKGFPLTRPACSCERIDLIRVLRAAFKLEIPRLLQVILSNFLLWAIVMSRYDRGEQNVIVATQHRSHLTLMSAELFSYLMERWRYASAAGGGKTHDAIARAIHFERADHFAIDHPRGETRGR